MRTNTGQKLSFADLGVELVVIAGGEAEVTAVAMAEGGEPLKVGKRYESEETGVQVLVVKPGAAELRCDGVAMVVKEPKKTKAAD